MTGLSEVAVLPQAHPYAGEAIVADFEPAPTDDDERRRIGIQSEEWARLDPEKSMEQIEELIGHLAERQRRLWEVVRWTALAGPTMRVRFQDGVERDVEPVAPGATTAVPWSDAVNALPDEDLRIATDSGPRRRGVLHMSSEAFHYLARNERFVHCNGGRRLTVEDAERIVDARILIVDAGYREDMGAEQKRYLPADIVLATDDYVSEGPIGRLVTKPITVAGRTIRRPMWGGIVGGDKLVVASARRPDVPETERAFALRVLV